MNGGGSWCFAGSVVVDQTYELWEMLTGSSGEEEELLGRIEIWERRERNILFIYLFIYYLMVQFILF